ncbi:MAG: hypothetical protein ACOC4M_00795 [Promethearchaeia archaeon]
MEQLKEHGLHYGVEIYCVYKDVGSRLDPKRKGLWRIRILL